MKLHQGGDQTHGQLGEGSLLAIGTPPGALDADIVQDYLVFAIEPGGRSRMDQLNAVADERQGMPIEVAAVLDCTLGVDPLVRQLAQLGIGENAPLMKDQLIAFPFVFIQPRNGVLTAARVRPAWWLARRYEAE